MLKLLSDTVLTRASPPTPPAANFAEPLPLPTVDFESHLYLSDLDLGLDTNADTAFNTTSDDSSCSLQPVDESHLYLSDLDSGLNNIANSAP